jgi:hypothetical protein
LLLASDVETVLDNICSTNAKDEDKKKTITYFYFSKIKSI